MEIKAGNKQSGDATTMTNSEKIIKYIEKHGNIDRYKAEELGISKDVFDVTLERIRKTGVYLVSKQKKNKEDGKKYREYTLYTKPKKIDISKINSNQKYVVERNKLIYVAEKQAREYMKEKGLDETFFHAVFHDKMDRMAFEVMGVKQSWMI